jgi:hypothetical protein
MSWPLAFGLTLVIELVVLLAVFRHEHRTARVILAAGAGNLLTHPIVYLVLPQVAGSYATYIITAELFAFGVEIPVILALVRPAPWYRAVGASALANGASYVTGLVLHGLLLHA